MPGTVISTLKYLLVPTTTLLLSIIVIIFILQIRNQGPDQLSDFPGVPQLIGRQCIPEPPLVAPTLVHAEPHYIASPVLGTALSLSCAHQGWQAV